MTFSGVKCITRFDKERFVGSHTESKTPEGNPQPQRLLSLDAYRGLIMVSLAFKGFGLRQTAENHLAANPDSSFWQTIHYQFSHVPWTGCGYWDLIQPSFMFMVGVSMAYSYAKRSRLGHAYGKMLRHALCRSTILILLGIFLISDSQSSTSWSLMNVLTQIGLGYTFLFLFWGRRLRSQSLGAALILILTWMLYVLYPAAGVDLATGSPEVGLEPEWAQEQLAEVSPAWHKNANLGHAVDSWLLNRLPRQAPFVYNEGGYQTINFIPSLATMLFGLMVGQLLRSRRSAQANLKALLAAGILGLIAGLIFDWTGLCPLIKRIWTPSWAIFSTGWCCLILAGLYALIDVANIRRWTFPLVVVGSNSIAIYSMSMLLPGWVAGTFQTHLGQDIFQLWGAGHEPALESLMVGLTFWLTCWWMYRRRIFLRV